MTLRKRKAFLKLMIPVLAAGPLFARPLTARALTPLTKENFDFRRYADENPELKQATGYNHDLLWMHYLIHGARGGLKAYTTDGDEGVLATQPGAPVNGFTNLHQNTQTFQNPQNTQDIPSGFTGEQLIQYRLYLAEQERNRQNEALMQLQYQRFLAAQSGAAQPVPEWQQAMNRQQSPDLQNRSAGGGNEAAAWQAFQSQQQQNTGGSFFTAEQAAMFRFQDQASRLAREGNYEELMKLYASANAGLLASDTPEEDEIVTGTETPEEESGDTAGLPEETVSDANGIPLTEGNFDFLRYADDYSDLKAAYGYNRPMLWNHYLHYGRGENRAVYATGDAVGIDVSSYQGDINWSEVKNAGIDYAVIRLGYRGSETARIVHDTKFEQHINGAINAGLRVGVYFVTQAVNEAEAVEEAQFCLNTVAGYGLSMPVFVDVEGSGGRGDTIDRATRTAVLKAFCQTVTNGGRLAGVYASKKWMTDNIDMHQLTQYAIWLAQYYHEKTWTETRVDAWQFTSSGNVPGVPGRVDVNRVYTRW